MSRFIFIIPCLAMMGIFALASPVAGQDAGRPDRPADRELMLDDDAAPQPPRGERRGPREGREGGPGVGPGGPGGPGGPPGVGGDFRRRRAELSQEEIADRFELLRQLHPEFAQRLEAERENSPDKFNRALAEQSPRLAILLETKKTDPQLYELMVANLQLERESLELARRHRQALRSEDPHQAEQLRLEMAEVVERHFDARQQMRERELHNLEQRLDQMRKSLAARREAREKIIDDRIEQLAGDRADRAEF